MHPASNSGDLGLIGKCSLMCESMLSYELADLWELGVLDAPRVNSNDSFKSLRNTNKPGAVSIESFYFICLMLKTLGFQR